MEATIEPGPSPVILIAVTWPWPFRSGERGCDPDSASRICVGAEDARAGGAVACGRSAANITDGS
jgi:hypothetical protein